jgi:hypothetical protein
MAEPLWSGSDHSTATVPAAFLVAESSRGAAGADAPVGSYCANMRLPPDWRVMTPLELREVL